MSHRTQITLEDAQYERLLKESRRTGLALAELVRRAITRTYGPVDVGERRRALRESSGAWKDRPFDGEEYVEGLRRGMARRLSEW